MSADQLKQVFADDEALRIATVDAHQLTCEAISESEQLCRKFEPVRSPRPLVTPSDTAELEAP